MKITRKILERLIKQEVKGLLIEQGTDPVTGQSVTVGGQDGQLGPIRVGKSSKLAANYSSNRPTEEQFVNEPVATYVMQRLDDVMAKLDKRVRDLEASMGDQEEPSIAIANQVDQVQERLMLIVKEETNNVMEEYTNELDPGQRSAASESPRSAHLAGSNYAAAGKYIGKGGNLAYERKKCQDHLKKWGDFQNMPACEKIMSDADVDATTQDAALSLKDIDDRLDDIDQRLNQAGIQ